MDYRGTPVEAQPNCYLLLKFMHMHGEKSYLCFFVHV